jgi:hypothetical protein
MCFSQRLALVGSADGLARQDKTDFGLMLVKSYLRIVPKLVPLSTS